MSADTTNLSTKDLAAALRTQAAGTLPDEAAVRLVIETDWLDRRDFRRHVDYTDDPDVTGGMPMAGVRWAEVVAALDSGELRASSTAARILRVAASFGGGVPVNLRETVTNSLGDFHGALVAAVVNHAITG